MTDFQELPSNVRVPLFYAEFDNSGAVEGPALLAYQGLLIGQKIAAGTLAAGTPQRVTSPEEVGVLAGQGSIAHGMAQAWFKSNTSTALTLILLDDNGAGVAATGTLTITGPATADGGVSLYIGGRRVQAAVSDTDDASTIAAAIVAAVTAIPDLPVTAGNVGGVVTFTAKNKGQNGNTIDLRLNYNDEALPAGVDGVIVAMNSGANNPDITATIAAMGDDWYNIIANPYTDAFNLNLLEDELSDRFGPIRMIDGMAFSAKSDTFANLVTFGNSRNSPHNTVQFMYKELRPDYEVAAESAAIGALAGQNDPARPMQTLEYTHRLAPAEEDRFTWSERNQLLFEGISTSKVDADGTVRVERMVTTYQENALGSPDVSYLDVNTLLTLMYIRFDWRVFITSKYPRHKLADDGTRFGTGQPIMTPSLAKSEAVNKWKDWADLGLVENLGEFKAALQAEIDATDKNRLNMTMPPNLVNQLRVFATLIRFLI